MKPYYSDEWVNLYHGDCLDVLRTLPDASVDSVVTDPPYGLEFMGKEWDSFRPGTVTNRGGGAPGRSTEAEGRWVAVEYGTAKRRTTLTCDGCGKSDKFKNPHDCPPNTGWTRIYLDNSANAAATMRAFQAWCELWARECLRVLKPGGHMLAFGGTRTSHRLACAIEDAGFEIRDSIAWLYGSGFPKSLDVSKAIDKRRDWSLVERLAGEIRRARADAGLSLAEIGQATIAATDGTYGKWYHRGGHMFFETGRSLPSRPEWEQLRRVLQIAPEFAEVYDEAERAVTGWHEQGNPIGAYEFKHGEGKGRTANERRDTPATPEAEQWQGWGTAMKPAWEIVVTATKPLTIWDKIGSRLQTLEDECRRLASNAGESSPPIHRASPEAKTATAPASAATPPEAEPERLTPTGKAADSSAPMDTSASASTVETFSNTVTSWSRLWAELCEATSTSTTETASSTTIDLRTLLSCLEQITPASITLDPTSPDGPSSLVAAVDAMFAAAVLSSRAIHALTATGSATSGTRPTPPAGGALSQVVVARKPLIGTVVANILAHGTGALNVDGCRIQMSGHDRAVVDSRSGAGSGGEGWGTVGIHEEGRRFTSAPAGRWPANVVLDESQAAALDEQSGEQRAGVAVRRNLTEGKRGTEIGFADPRPEADQTYGDIGGASRFFYTAKAGSDERPTHGGTSHPTVKPLALMRWLVRLVTPPGGTVLEPFAGSGTTAEACLLERFHCIAIEREADYLPLIVQRITRRRDPIAYLTDAGHDLGLFAEDETA